MDGKSAGLRDLFNLLGNGDGKKLEEAFIETSGGKIVTIKGVRFLAFKPYPTPPPASKIFGEIVFSNESGIVGIVSKNLKQRYSIGVPLDHPWSQKKARFFSSLKDPISKSGNLSHTDLDSLEKKGKIFRDFSIQSVIETIPDKRERYWIEWDYDYSESGSAFSNSKAEIIRICEVAEKM